MNDATIMLMVDEEYKRTLQAVSEATTSTEEAKWELQKLAELHKQRMEEIKTSGELAFQDQENKIKEAQVADGKKDRIIKIALDGAAILVPVMVSSYWMSRGLRFEQTGTFTSHTGQWLSNHLKLFKK